LLETHSLNRFDIIVLCAALSDYKPDKIDGKISSNSEKLLMELKPTKKIIEILRKLAPKAIIIGFKLEKNSKNLKKRMEELIEKYSLDFVVGNTTSAIQEDKSEIWIIDKKCNMINRKGTKFELADQIFNTVLKR
jgi:phosphopantothenoylcysteine decarboxylase/phosphopantothenate--cysteine ligase